MLPEDDRSSASSAFEHSSFSKRDYSREISTNSDFDGASSGYGSVQRMRTISELSDHTVSNCNCEKFNC